MIPPRTPLISWLLLPLFACGPTIGVVADGGAEAGSGGLDDGEGLETGGDTGRASTEDGADSESSDGASGSGEDGDPAPACGDATVDPDEICDDGNRIDGDGCNVDCRPSGELLWHALVEDDPGAETWGHMVAADDAGGAVVAGMRRSPDGVRSVHVTRFDSTGEVVWSADVSPQTFGAPNATGAAIDSLGRTNVVVSDPSQDGAPTLMRFGADGESLPALVLGPPRTHVFSAVLAEYDAGGLAAAGCSEDGAWVSRLPTEANSGWTGSAAEGCVVDIDAAGDELVVLVSVPPEQGRHVQRWSPEGTLLSDTSVECRGSLATDRTGVAYVSSPAWSEEDEAGLCVIGTAGQLLDDPFGPTLLHDALQVAIADDGSLLALSWLPDDGVAIQKVLGSASPGWDDLVAERASYALPFDLAVGGAGHVAASGVFFGSEGREETRAFVYVWTP